MREATQLTGSPGSLSLPRHRLSCLCVLRVCFVCALCVLRVCFVCTSCVCVCVCVSFSQIGVPFLIIVSLLSVRVFLSLPLLCFSLSQFTHTHTFKHCMFPAEHAATTALTPFASAILTHPNISSLTSSSSSSSSPSFWSFWYVDLAPAISKERFASAPM